MFKRGEKSQINLIENHKLDANCANLFLVLRPCKRHTISHIHPFAVSITDTLTHS